MQSPSNPRSTLRCVPRLVLHTLHRPPKASPARFPPILRLSSTRTTMRIAMVMCRMRTGPCHLPHQWKRGVPSKPRQAAMATRTASLGNNSPSRRASATSRAPSCKHMQRPAQFCCTKTKKTLKATTKLSRATWPNMRSRHCPLSRHSGQMCIQA